MAEINLRSVLSSVLLQVLAKHPGGMSIHDAYDAIDSEYEFPEDWYELIPKGGAYDELKALGYPDWRVLTESQLVQMVATEPKWQNEMRRARQWLQDQGYIDKTSGRGIWRLNSAGLKAAKLQGTALVLFGLQPQARLIFSITQADGLFAIVGTEAEAIAALTRRAV